MRSNIENGSFKEFKCTFCALDPTRILATNKHAVAVLDGFPISPGHTLIIPKRHIITLFETTTEELIVLLNLLFDARKQLIKKQNPDGFNIGMALCKLCHWAFDEGMLGVSDNYNVITSRQIGADPNVPGFLLTLSGRSIIPPYDRDLWPAQEYLNWHRKEFCLSQC